MISAMDGLVVRAAGNLMLPFSRKVLASHPTTMTPHVARTIER